MFSREAMRLLREKWGGNADLLAEELYAIFSSINLPLSHSGPITLTMRPGETVPALTIQTSDPGQTALQITRPNAPPINFNEGGIDLGTGQITQSPLAPFTLPTSTPAGETGSYPANPDQPQPNKGGGGGNAGHVLSGSGSNYVVQLVDGTIVNATQGQIASTETVPAGTFVLLAQVDGVFYMQAPVWLS